MISKIKKYVLQCVAPFFQGFLENMQYIFCNVAPFFKDFLKNAICFFT